MLKIETKNGVLDLSADFSIHIDENSPIFNDRGSQTVPLTVPVTGSNAAALGFAHRLDLTNAPMAGNKGCVLSDGVYRRTGTVNIVSAGKNDGITMNIGFDNSEAYVAWNKKKLSDMECLPVVDYNSAIDLCVLLSLIFRGLLPSDKYDFAVFQIVTDLKSKEENNITTYYPEYINEVKGKDIQYTSRSINLLVGDTVTPTKVPAGYGVSPFVYVWRVVELVFQEFGYTLAYNAFKEYAELARLVVLNNAADACCTGKLHYADLMPSCTVEEFLHSLYVRFGAVYAINSETKVATLKLIRDLIAEEADKDYTDILGDDLLVTYEAAKQITLTAQRSLDGADVAEERWEDWIKDRKDLVLSVNKFNASDSTSWINWEKPTGKFYKYDKENNRKSYSSSSFFDWNRQTENVETEDLSADDECVPMDWAQNGILSPQYKTGYVHRYTQIVATTNDEETADSESTPLAMVFAFNSPTNAAYTFGSILPYTPDGEQVSLPDGSKHSISLLFQFENGLFANFWKDYDAILRHANNQVEASVYMQPHEIMQVNLLSPILIGGQKMLIDTLSYDLPTLRRVVVSAVFRTMKLLKPYDLENEQSVMNIASPRLRFKLRSTDLQEVIKATEEKYCQWMLKQYDDVQIYDTSYDLKDYLTPETDEGMMQCKPDVEGEVVQKTYKVDITIIGKVWWEDVDQIGEPLDCSKEEIETYTNVSYTAIWVAVYI